jgi:monovalent cation/hydrogen antiporter
VILATLVAQGLTLGPLIRALRLKVEGNQGTLMELRARLEGARAALERLERLCDDGRVPQGAQEQMREHYEGRIRRYEDGIEAGGATEEYAQSSEAWRNWRRDLIGAEREAILSLRDSGDISPEVMRRIERDLDLEESRIGG